MVALGATGGISRDIKNQEYKGIPTDEYGRTLDFKVFSCMRPWYRAFHASWISFFVAFLGWFSIVPCLEYIVADTSNDVTNDVKKTSNIVSVLGTIFVRFALGPVCERFGARRPQAVLLLGGGTLVLISSSINSASGLLAIRFFIGLVGGAFVPCQYWTTMMFGTRVVGTANAFAGGWGNLGGGAALALVASIISGIRSSGVEDETAWSYALIVPGLMMICVAIPMLLFSDDCPQGHWSNRLYNDPNADKIADEEAPVKDAPVKKASHLDVVLDYRVWLLALIYAACFGVELALNNSLSGFLYRYFNTDADPSCTDLAVQISTSYPASCSTLGKDTASQIASLFGLMNLFARALGGVGSDFAFYRFGMRGRLGVLMFTLLGEAAMLVVFSQVTAVPTAIGFLVCFSIFVQASEGATFAIVPFLNPGNIGNVAGIVGAGGNIGAVSWSTMFKSIDSQRDAYLYLAFIIFGVAAFVSLIPVQGQYLFGCRSKPLSSVETASEASEDIGDSSVHGTKETVQA
ncbi:High-affinity nitrate transporter 2.2 [Hondaea fermentalgiana]|uniref:High-affinity nitrate transporter 2.2 n=1 Tax=Hondaea fermentalgiana TaxID=2315210 RepID=A0A2R5GN25_9STRA|nr:High-affinity nitrate transporter 2.2 [Hondaea fermentalgiana]|eukprot:GBG31699.1 High-affinity nitrate transporter 2.2 [Hondaea fermentalgiana]